jgi:hypothetical protein
MLEIFSRLEPHFRRSEFQLVQTSGLSQGKAAARAAGADALLTHPIDPAVLLDVVTTLLAAKKSASSN